MDSTENGAWKSIESGKKRETRELVLFQWFVQTCACVFVFQYYSKLAGARYVDLGLGTHRVKCKVDTKFR